MGAQRVIGGGHGRCVQDLTPLPSEAPLHGSDGGMGVPPKPPGQITGSESQRAGSYGEGRSVLLFCGKTSAFLRYGSLPKEASGEKKKKTSEKNGVPAGSAEGRRQEAKQEQFKLES